MSLHPRQHIQDHSTAAQLKHYWGYASRVIPCVNDKGTCEYLDAVYWMHTVSMMYTFILWAVIGGILLIFLIARVLRWRSGRGIERGREGVLARLWNKMGRKRRRYLLPEIGLRRVFPYTTRLQVLLLACLSVYLIIFSLVGITYKTWITPIKGSTKHNTRTGLGGFSDRIGALAYALTPLTIALSTRDSILSLLTGIPYQNFNFLHRWTGKIIFFQSALHTIGWTVIEARLYQPQPKVFVKWIRQEYMVWGVVAQILIIFLFVGSTRWGIRMTGYEFFRKAHLVVAGVYLGACWAHWAQLACWMIASLGILGIDLGLRVFRICLIHVGYKNGNQGLGFRAIGARMQKFEDPTGTIVRMEFEHNHEPWKIGQHFYITFPALSIWQGHPFTPASVPPGRDGGEVPKHVYIVRARKGETGRLADLIPSAVTEDAAGKETGSENIAVEATTQTPVILTGPYGVSILDRVRDTPNLQAIAGGTGISFTLPVIMDSLRSKSDVTQNVEMVWIIRHLEDLRWIAPELDELTKYLIRQGIKPGTNATEVEEKTIVKDESGSSSHSIAKDEGSVEVGEMASPIPYVHGPQFRLRIFTTRFTSASSFGNAYPVLQQSPNVEIIHLNGTHPSIPDLLNTFGTDSVSSGATTVVASGPPGLGTDIRSAVAEANQKADLRLIWDDRLG